MQIIIANPPNIDAIHAVFGVKGKPGVIFTYGDRIYNPSGANITESLREHELIHSHQQTTVEANIIRWWETYLVDPQFRLEQELPAHIAEYRKFCDRYPDRNRRTQMAHAIAGRLSGPLYGNLMGPGKARSLLMKAVH